MKIYEKEGYYGEIGISKGGNIEMRVGIRIHKDDLNLNLNCEQFCIAFEKYFDEEYSTQWSYSDYITIELLTYEDIHTSREALIKRCEQLKQRIEEFLKHINSLFKGE